MDASLVARRFALGAVEGVSPGPVARGREGLVWRLDTATGSWAVKEPFEPPADDADLAGRLQEAAHRAGVPTPVVRRTRDGRLVDRVGDSPVRVYGWVDILPADRRLDPERVGAAVAASHRVEIAEAAPPDAWYREGIGADGWDGLVARVRDAGAPFAERLAAAREEFVALESWLEPEASLRACHRDLWADNVRGTAGGGVCVIDWDNAGLADPSQELACVLFEFADGDPERARVLHDAYRRAGGPAAVTRRGHFSMLIAQLGHITAMAAACWLVPGPRAPTREEAAAWVAETLDDPHTRERLEALLDAVTG